MYLYIYIYIHVFIHVYIHVITYMYLYVYIYTYIPIYISTHIHIHYIHIQTYTYIYIYTDTNKHTYTKTYILKYVKLFVNCTVPKLPTSRFLIRCQPVSWISIKVKQLVSTKCETLEQEKWGQKPVKKSIKVD